MKKIRLKGKTGECDIILGESIRNLDNHCKAEKTVIITDRNVLRLHGTGFPEFEVAEIGTGEKAKTLDTVREIYRRFLGLDRSTFVVGIGGGVVCDIAGFAASTYLRGLRFGFVPTTLVAQADASIGGKNGVNFMGYKNLVGVFSQPGFVLCDFGLLKTLPSLELRCGLAEIVKHALVGDAGLFQYLEQGWKGVLSLREDCLEKVVSGSVAVKARVVSRDETETGERMLLNLGHTVGHAIEKAEGIPHGEAISIGMVAAANLSVKRKLLSKRNVERLEALLENIGLPTSMGCDKDTIHAVIDAMEKDKKLRGDKINFVLLKEIGKPVIARIDVERLEEVFDDMR